MALIRDCDFCDGRGCGRCGGSGIEPPTPKQVAEMYANAASVLYEDACKSGIQCTIIHIETEDTFIFQTRSGERISRQLPGIKMLIPNLTVGMEGVLCSIKEGNHFFLKP